VHSLAFPVALDLAEDGDSWYKLYRMLDMAGDAIVDEDQFVLCCRHVLELEESAISDAELCMAFAHLEARLDHRHLCGLLRIRELLDFIRTPGSALAVFMHRDNPIAELHPPLGNRTKAHETEVRLAATAGNDFRWSDPWGEQ
jgi:hypothetical protein